MSGYTIIVMVIVLLYLVITMATGIIAGRKGKHDGETTLLEYVAASRNLGFFVTYFLMGGAIFSAFAFLGGPGTAYSQGAVAFYIIAFASIGFVPWLLWGTRSYRMGKRYGYVTQAELFADRFESKALSAIMAIISGLALIQNIAVQIKGMAYIINVTSGNYVPFWLGGLIAYGVVVIYVLTSGVRGVAWTNVLQGILMIVTAWTLGLYLPVKFHGGIGTMFEKIATTNPELLLIGAKMSWAAFSSAIIVSVLGFTMWPHLFMKAYVTDSEKTLKKTVAMYPTFAIFLVPVLLIGFSAVGIVPYDTLKSTDEILPHIVSILKLSPGIMGLVTAATLAAAMSSTDTITHAAASIYTLDFHKKIINPSVSDKNAIRITRIAILVFCSAAYYVAIFGGKSIVALLLGAYGSIVQFFPLCVAMFFWPRANKYGAIAGLLTGTAINYYITFAKVSYGGINSGVWGLLGNIIVLVVVSLLTEPQSEKHLKKFIEESQIPLESDVIS
ncbi:sodium:solute symporter [Fusibacter sp. 3D3]|uniref:sodium:solute symporter family protein n=1 Tax=Fusibacter sp. 3D3 TaxID=1048380 RepID=UPI0008538D10|nr:sodium:solute symporter family protein [Fusibacter sp. 3D3]GAU75926.1 Na+/solute symporter [Fusibacter sp. 3D3]